MSASSLSMSRRPRAKSLSSPSHLPLPASKLKAKMTQRSSAFAVPGVLAITVVLTFYSRVKTSTVFIPQKTGFRTPVLHTASEQAAALRRDYDRRSELAYSAGRSPPALRFIRWVHIPKTGTSFVNTVIRWGCPKAPKDIFIVPRKERPEHLVLPLRETFSWDWLFNNASGRAWLRANCDGRLVSLRPDSLEPHYALYMHRALQPWEVNNAIAIFRLPLQRMYSNYLHLNLHFNESRTFREPLELFLQKKQFWSQQAKLLLGRHYRDKRELTKRDGLKATLIVKRLQFVGLTEEFQLSSRLFHAMFGGVPHRAQFENVRPGISRYQDRKRRSSKFRYDERVFHGWTDPTDHMVYEAARRRFWREVRMFKQEIERDGLGEVKIDSEQAQY